MEKRRNIRKENKGKLLSSYKHNRMSEELLSNYGRSLNSRRKLLLIEFSCMKLRMKEQLRLNKIGQLKEEHFTSEVKRSSKNLAQKIEASNFVREQIKNFFNSLLEYTIVLSTPISATENWKIKKTILAQHNTMNLNWNHVWVLSGNYHYITQWESQKI